MARLHLIVAVALFSLLSGLVAAESTFLPSLVIPVEHRSDGKAVRQSEPTAVSLDGYDLQIVPSDQFDVETTSLSVWDFLPNLWALIPGPFTVLKAICHKIWKIIKFTIPLDLIVLGMALVVGFCAFTPYCTLIIERPLAYRLRSFRESIPYIDEAETMFYQAYDKFQELQNDSF